MESGLLSCWSAFAWLCGRLIGTPTVRSGAETMNTINSTSMTSTNGVTLISLMTGRRRRFARPPAAAMFMLPAAIPCPRPIPRSPALVDLSRQDRRELVGESLKPLRLPVHLGRELIIENGRRDGGNETDRGCEQSLGDARGDHSERGVLRRGDRLKARH